MREYELTTQRMLKHYTDCTELDQEEVRSKLLPPEDKWLSADEALALNLCDSIIS